jgi:hypothetical protein
MKRSIVLALAAALALAIGGGATATAATTDGATQTAAKKGKKKAAKCKAAKKKKGKASADAAKKGKKKAAKCKKATPKKKAKPGPKPPATPAPPDPGKPAPAAGLTDGEYSDAGKGVTVTISEGVTKARVSAGPNKCSGGFAVGVEGPIAQQGSEVKGGQTSPVFGGAGTVQWSLTVTPATLAYKFDAVWSVQFPDQDPCQDTVAVQGTLSR